MYALYAELYGTAGAKPIARWTLDIYATPVMIDDVREMLHAPELKARVEVAALNEKFAVNEPLARRRDDESFWYRCCCRCEFLIPCLGRLLSGPSYKADDDDATARKRKKKKAKRRSSRRRRRSYDYDASDDGSDDDDSDASEDERETRGLLG